MQPVFFLETSHPAQILDRAESTLTCFFKYNQDHDDGHQYLYQEFPEHYAYHPKKGERKWTRVSGVSPLAVCIIAVPLRARSSTYGSCLRSFAGLAVSKTCGRSTGTCVRVGTRCPDSVDDDSARTTRTSIHVGRRLTTEESDWGLLPLIYKHVGPARLAPNLT